MEQRLYEAAVEGSIPSLHELLGEDPRVLDKVIKNCFDETILHVAVLQGHVDFVKEILELKSELAGELDSQFSSPLHLASANGNIEIVKALLLTKAEMCGVLDRDGKNPLHLAAINGRVDVLKELVQACPTAARATLDHGRSNIMHVCVQHNQLEALKILAEKLNDEEFVNSKDEHEETILHKAVADKQIEMIKYLLSSARIKVNEVNVNGLTPLDILAQSRRDVKDLDIGDSLRQAGALRAKDMPSGNENGTIRPNSILPTVQDQSTPLQNDSNHGGTLTEWLKEKQNMLMLVASLMVPVTFQAAINPPGGVWQDDSPDNFEGRPETNRHKAGDAVMASNHPRSYAYFSAANLAGFITSLITLLLLMIASSFRNDLYSGALIVVMCFTVISILITVFVSIKAITPDKFKNEIGQYQSREASLIMLIIFLFLILLTTCILLIRRHRHLRRESSSVDVNHANGDQEAPLIQLT